MQYPGWREHIRLRYPERKTQEVRSDRKDNAFASESNVACCHTRMLEYGGRIIARQREDIQSDEHINQVAKVGKFNLMPAVLPNSLLNLSLMQM